MSAMEIWETSDVWNKHRQPARLLCSNPSSALDWYTSAPEWAVEGAQAQDETHYGVAETNNETRASQAGSTVSVPGCARKLSDSE